MRKERIFIADHKQRNLQLLLALGEEHAHCQAEYLAKPTYPNFDY